MNTDIPKPKEGWIYYGHGPLKVIADETQREDVAMYAYNSRSKQRKWDYDSWGGDFEGRHYALRAGSEIARLNGLGEPDVKPTRAVTLARNGYIEDLERQLAEAREEARTWETRYDEMIRTCVLTAKERDDARAGCDLLDALYTKVGTARLKCDPIPACEREDDTLEPPWEVIDRLRRERDEAHEALKWKQRRVEILQNIGRDLTWQRDTLVAAAREALLFPSSPATPKLREVLDLLSTRCKNAIDTTTPKSEPPQPHDTQD